MTIGLTTAAVHHDRVGPMEERVFRLVNNLPDSIYRPAWLVMQLGTLAAVPVAAAAARAAGDRRLAARILFSGSGTWFCSKLVKRTIRRPRPAHLLAGTRRRGTEPAGLGYLSGHAGVAVALGVAAFPRTSPGGRVLILTLVPTVGLARMYVGAHLPLDVLGGAALGLGMEAAAQLYHHATCRSKNRQVTR